MSLLETYKQLLKGCDCEKGHCCTKCLIARGFALACQQLKDKLSKHKSNDEIYIECCKVITLAKQQGHLK